MSKFMVNVRELNNTKWYLIVDTSTGKSYEYPEFYIRNIIDTIENIEFRNNSIVGSTGDISRYMRRAVTVAARIDKDGDMSYRCIDSSGNIFVISSDSVDNYEFTNACKVSNGRLRGINWTIPTEVEHYKTYLLMNKDKLVCKFKDFKRVSSISSRLPYDFTDLKTWIDARSRFSCAHNVKEFFKRIGIYTSDDFIEIFHCVALTDTFWMKEEGTKLRWKDVSPFERDYSLFVSNYALDGRISGVMDNKNYFSPDVATGGSFPHTWKKAKNGDIIFIKGSSKYTLGGRNSGQEPVSEYYASKVCDFLGMNHIRYGLRVHKRVDGNEDLVTYCKCYTSEDKGSVSASNLGLTSYEDVLQYAKSLNASSFRTVVDMLFLDCLLLNTDRHFSNIEFFMDTDTLDIIDVVPIYDNNYSLLPQFLVGYDTFLRDEYKFTRDDVTTFEELFRLLLRYDRKRCMQLLSKSSGIKLEQPEKCTIPKERLDFLNKFTKFQLKWLRSLVD